MKTIPWCDSFLRTKDQQQSADLKPIIEKAVLNDDPAIIPVGQYGVSTTIHPVVTKI